MRLSATVMTHDSMETLPTCLDSLGFCDEIVVVDDFSTDGTWEYLCKRGEKVRAFQNKLETFARQRQFLAGQARGEWLLILDADEEATPELAAELGALLSSPDSIPAAFWVPLKNLAPASWRSEAHFWIRQKRLVKRGAVSWDDSQWVHAPATHAGKPGLLQHGVIHRPYDSVLHLLRKQLSYAGSTAHHHASTGRRSSLAKLVVHSAGAFIKFYVLKGLFRFGMGGFLLAAAQAIGALSKYAFLWELERDPTAHQRTRVPGEQLPHPYPAKQTGLRPKGESRSPARGWPYADL